MLFGGVQGYPVLQGYCLQYCYLGCCFPVQKQNSKVRYREPRRLCPVREPPSPLCFEKGVGPKVWGGNLLLLMGMPGVWATGDLPSNTSWKIEGCFSPSPLTKELTSSHPRKGVKIAQEASAAECRSQVSGVLPANSGNF